jgi:hypothetical protein
MTEEQRAATIAGIYAQLAAPAWAAPNLDALADVLRDLSWLPAGPVTIRVPAGADARVRAVLERVARESAGGPRAVEVEPGDTTHTG